MRQGGAMKKPAKTGLLAATLVLVGASVAGCSGGVGGGAPTDASEDEFCDTMTSLFSEPGAMAEMTKEEGVAEVKGWAKDLRRVGTPESISEEARDGFELMIREVGKFGEDDTAEGLATLQESLSASEKVTSEAFDAYSTDTCGSILGNQELPEVPAPS